MVTRTELLEALGSLGLAGATVCVHGSLRSFGTVDGGAESLVDALCAHGRTVMMPAFYYHSSTLVPEAFQIPRNGLKPVDAKDPQEPLSVPESDNPPPVPYEPRNPAHIDRSMGILPVTLLNRPETIRGDHPLNAFAAAGPHASRLMAGQAPMDPYAPYRLLDEMENAWIVLMGVGLNRATPIHFGEVLAGRGLFHRWAGYADGRVVETLVGSCSEGFPRFDPHVRDIETRVVVGESTWRIFRFHEFVHRIAEVVTTNPNITHCEDPACERCNDMVAGGPALP